MNKECKHPKIKKEYLFGMQTGDYECTSCGKVSSLNILRPGK